MKNVTITLTIDELYALEGIFAGLSGMTKQICQNYQVDSEELLEKLEAVSDEWVNETYGNPA